MEFLLWWFWGLVGTISTLLMYRFVEDELIINRGLFIGLLVISALLGPICIPIAIVVMFSVVIVSLNEKGWFDKPVVTWTPNKHKKEKIHI